MSDLGWNPWKLATIGILVVFATALATGVVVANYMSATDVQTPDTQRLASTNAPVTADTLPSAVPPAAAPQAPALRAPAVQATAGQAPALPHRRVGARPSAADIEDCNRYAAATHDRVGDTLKDALFGGAAGAGLGAAGGAIAGGGGGAGKGAGIGALVGVTAGTLVGLNDANKRNNRAAAAYRACMRRRGYSG
jgi:hypothetical protein